MAMALFPKMRDIFPYEHVLDLTNDLYIPVGNKF